MTTYTGEPTSTIADVMAAVGAKTADLMALNKDERIAMRLDLDREIAAFHAEGQQHPVEAIAKKYPRSRPER